MEKKRLTATLNIIISMTVFGTIGLMRRSIALPSGALAMTRGIVGGLMLLAVFLIKNKKISLKDLGKKKIPLFISGALIGINWIALFEAYRYTTVATATLCYYMAPVLIIIASFFFFKERLGVRKTVCVIFAIAGMVLVSGVLNAGFSFGQEFKGVLLGLFAAVLYAIIIIMNKSLSDVPPFERTIIQLISAGAVLIPYTFIFEDFSGVTLDAKNIVFILIVCFVHTGLSYFMYFGAIPHLPAQTAAILSYIDPTVAVLLSALVLKEPLGFTGVIGAVLIIGAMAVSEINITRKKDAR